KKSVSVHSHVLRFVLSPAASRFLSTQPFLTTSARRTSVSQKFHFFRLAALLICGLLLLAFGSFAQTVTGTISGSVADSTGQVIVGASVKLTNEATGDVRTGETNGSGEFTFPVLQPGTYRVRVESQGFRAYEKAGNILSASERLSLGSQSMQVGSLTETISVTAQGTTVQTD